MISSPVLDGYRLCHVRELIFNSAESLCVFGRGYETDYKNAHTQTSGLSPVWAAGSFSLQQKAFLPVLTGIMQWLKIQRNGLGMSNNHDLQDATQTDLAEDEMGQRGRGLWEPHRTSLAFSQRFHQQTGRIPFYPPHTHTHTHTASFMNLLARLYVSDFIGQTKLKFPPDLQTCPKRLPFHKRQNYRKLKTTK